MDTPDRDRRARSFGAQAAAYDRGRPGYPAAALRYCLPDDATTVLDLGAGTGKLTAGLLELGLAVSRSSRRTAMRALIPSGRARPGRHRGGDPAARRVGRRGPRRAGVPLVRRRAGADRDRARPATGRDRRAAGTGSAPGRRGATRSPRCCASALTSSSSTRRGPGEATSATPSGAGSSTCRRPTRSSSPTTSRRAARSSSRRPRNAAVPSSACRPSSHPGRCGSRSTAACGARFESRTCEESCRPNRRGRSTSLL